MDDIASTIVFRWLAAGDGGNLDAFDELLHPDAVVHAPTGLSTASADEEEAVWRDGKIAEAWEIGGERSMPTATTCGRSSSGRPMTASTS